MGMGAVQQKQPKSARRPFTLTPLNFLELSSGCNSQFADVILNLGYTPSITLTVSFYFVRINCLKTTLALSIILK